MTNLQRWLLYLGCFIIPYLALLKGATQSPVLKKWEFELQLVPIIFVIAFGAYAAITVLYRTFTFNDCPEAANELQKHIQQAREDLTSKGFVFRD